MPKSLVVIGSGAIGIEFASFYRALGAEVTVVEAVDRIMPVEDAEVSKAAQKAFEKRGITFRIGAKVTKVDEDQGRRLGGRSRSAARPRPWTAAVGIVAVGIAAEHRGHGPGRPGREHGPRPRRHRQATARPTCPASTPSATPPARPGWRTRPATRASTRRAHRRLQDAGNVNSPIPGCTYANPQVASVGLTEAAAKAAGHRGQGRPLPVPRQRQGRGGGRDRRLRQDGVRRQDRRPDRRPHDRPRGHRDDPGLRHGHHPGSHRGRPARPRSSRTRP